MKKINKFDKLLLLLGLLVVIAIFVLALVVYSKGGSCAVNPCEYIKSNNISCYNPFTLQIN